MERPKNSLTMFSEQQSCCHWLQVKFVSLIHEHIYVFVKKTVQFIVPATCNRHFWTSNKT